MSGLHPNFVCGVSFARACSPRKATSPLRIQLSCVCVGSLHQLHSKFQSYISMHSNSNQKPSQSSLLLFLHLCFRRERRDETQSRLMVVVVSGFAGAKTEEDLRSVDHTTRRGFMQGCVAPAGLGVQFDRPLFDKEGTNIIVAVMSRYVQRRPPSVSSSFEVRPGLVQNVQHRHVAVRRGLMSRRVITSSSGVGHCSEFQQSLRHTGTSENAGDVQKSVAAFVYRNVFSAYGL